VSRPEGAVAAVAAAARSAPPDCLIEARNLARSFGPTRALRGASVSVAAGEILAVMGPSGSGKSTLLHCVVGILAPDSGEVWLGGRPRCCSPTSRPDPWTRWQESR
jgi:putative ABC transport system ATP-binding protein